MSTNVTSNENSDETFDETPEDSNGIQFVSPNTAVTSVKSVSIEDGDCRICLQPDNLRNLIIPCECKGSQKYAHKVCLKQWMDIKHSDRCGVCKEPYSGVFFQRKPDHFFHYLIDNEGALIGIVIGSCLLIFFSYLLLIGFLQYFTSYNQISQGLRWILIFWTSFYALFFGLILIGSLIALRNGYQVWSSTHFVMEVIQDDDSQSSNIKNISKTT